MGNVQRTIINIGLGRRGLIEMEIVKDIAKLDYIKVQMGREIKTLKEAYLAVLPGAAYFQVVDADGYLHFFSWSQCVDIRYNKDFSKKFLDALLKQGKKDIEMSESTGQEVG